MLAIDSGATVRPPKLAADTVATAGAGRAARPARIDKNSRIDRHRELRRNLRRRGWTIVRIRRHPRTLRGRASKDGAREIHRRLRKIDRLNQLVGRSRIEFVQAHEVGPIREKLQIHASALVRYAVSIRVRRASDCHVDRTGSVNVLTQRAYLRGAILVVIDGAVRRPIIVNVRATVPLKPAVLAIGAAVSAVVADARVMAPPLELVTVDLLPEIGSDTPVSKRYGMYRHRTFRMHRTCNLTIAVQSGRRDSANLRGAGKRQNNATLT